MAQITGGKVSYGRTVKTGDYENKKIEVELTFSVDPGESYAELFDLASRQVIRRCEEMVKGNVTQAAEAAAPVSITMGSGGTGPNTLVTTTPAAQAEAAAVVDTKPKRGPGRPKKDAAPATKDEPEVTEAKTAELTKPSPAAAHTEGLASTDADDISDKQITEAITNKAKSVGPDKIKALVWEINGKPQSFSREIMQAKRPEFLKRLAALE
jgi:hypothetical protein